MENQLTLEEMRSQYGILKQQLEKQEIVTERLLRETMKVKTQSISQTKRMTYICVGICLILYPMNYLMQAWSLAFTIATCVMMLFCGGVAYYIHKPVERLNLMKDDFATVARVMAKFKKQYHDQLYYVTPALLTPWFLWLCYEFAWKNAPEGASPWPMLLPLIFSAGIGLFIGYTFHRKAVNAAQDIINDIEAN